MRRHISLLFIAMALIFSQLIDRYMSTREAQFERGEQALTALDPGEFVGTVALGGFRMIAVNMLWVRAFDNQEQDKHFSALADAELITKLQPGMPEVWSFIAWNLAYNISVLEDNEEEGYHWVRSGIATLSRGCERARQSKRIWTLRESLGWFYYHRVGPQFAIYYAKIQQDKELNPRGLNPLLLAIEQFDKACSHPDHALTADFLLYRSLLDALAGLPLSDDQRREFHQKVKMIRKHLTKEHVDLQLAPRRAIYDQQYQSILRSERRGR
jgi:hypothetical protein